MAYSPLLPLGSQGARSTYNSGGYIRSGAGGVGLSPMVSPALQGVYPTPPNSATNRRPSSLNDTKDVVQFFSKTFYVNETDTHAEVRVIRIGSLHGTCSVEWYTKDFSAVDGRKYHSGEGLLTFGPGESVRSFEVQIINDDNFDTALEFDVLLRDPQHCVVDDEFAVASVMILDDDLFPANDFKEEIESDNAEDELYGVGFSLLWSFIKFCFVHVDQIWWKTILVLLLANLGNAYYLATIFMKVYLIDTVLNTKDEHAEERLWVKGDRNATAICLGLAWVLPNFILLATDYFEMKVLEMGFNIRYHLRVNLFRKYLRYTQESKAEVPVQDLKISIMEDIPDVVSDGYLILFELWAMFGKIGMVTIFMLKKTPGTALQTLLFYPLLIGVYLWCTYRRRLELMAKEGEGQSQTIGTLMHAHNNHKLINCYEKKTVVVRHFEEVLKSQRKYVMDLKSFSFWNGQLIPWITLLAVGFYIGGSAQMVLGGRTSLGSLLTTINIYKDLGDRFSTILDGLKALSRAVSPLAGLTIQFNLETDIQGKASTFKAKEKYALSCCSSGTAKGFDDIPISFQNVSVDQSPTFKKGDVLSAEAPQGSVIQIVGPHDSGKGAILRRICEVDNDAPGMVMISPHLTVLQVPHEPLFQEGHGVFSNLHMENQGAKGFNKNASARGRRILERLGLGKEWILEMYDAEEVGATEAEAEKPPPISPMSCYEEEEEEAEEDEHNPLWAQKLSGSEKWRFQLARAFVYDPHVLVVHRPVDELDSNLQSVVLKLFREFVDKKGLEVVEEPGAGPRRPRTLIFSTGLGEHSKTSIPDYIWRLTADKGVQVEKHTPVRT